LYIGVNGITTFTKKPDQQAVYRQIPLDALLLETDAPFLTPAPYRGKICEPYHVLTTLEFLAGQRGELVETIAAVTTENARQLFGI
jgi:TatD DNase family protein